MANGGAFLAFVAVVAAIGFNLSLHKIEEGRKMKLGIYSLVCDGFIGDSCIALSVNTCTKYDYSTSRLVH